MDSAVDNRRTVRNTLEEEADVDLRSNVSIDKVDFLSDINGTTVDIGCGDGIYLPYLRKEATYLIGLDLSRTRLRRAKTIHKDLVLADVLKLCFKDEAFDTVVLIDVLEHVIYVEEVIAEINRILKRKGKLYIATPNKFVYRISRFIDAKFFRHREPTKTHYSEMTYGKVKKVITKKFNLVKAEGRLGSKWPSFLLWLKNFPHLAPNLMVLCEKRKSSY